MRLVLLGAPGSGKGTQAQWLAEEYGVAAVSTGDIFRSEIAGGTELGAKAETYMGTGALVPDDLVLAMMGERLKKSDMEPGFLLDGFPRSIPQAEGLDRILTRMGVGLDAVVKLDVPKRVLLDRMIGRRICGNCATVYNTTSNPPKEAGICDRCGSKIIQRKDDTEETVRKRLAVYEAESAALIDFYDGQGLLVLIDGDGAVADVRARLAEAMRDRSKNRA